MRNCQAAFQWLYHFAIPSAVNESSYCSMPSPAFGFVSVLDFFFFLPWHLIVVWICNSIMTCDVEHPFICLFTICGEVSNKLFCLLFVGFSLLLRLKVSSLHILEDSPLWNMSFANIFSLCVACLLILMTVSLVEKRF